MGIRVKDEQVRKSFAKLRKELQNDTRSFPGSMTLTSAFRTAEDNDAAGGVKGSRHLTGEALDIRVNGESEENIANIKKHFADKGYKVLRHTVPNGGDHIHVEKAFSNDSNEIQKLSDVPVKLSQFKKSENMASQDNGKLQAMLELERRGKLPQEKIYALNELRNRGIIPQVSKNPEIPESILSEIPKWLKNSGKEADKETTLSKVVDKGKDILSLAVPPLSLAKNIDTPTGRKVTSGLSQFSRGATANLVDPVSAGISTAIGEGLQLAGVVPDTPISETYDWFRKNQQDDEDKFSRENPGLSAGLELAGLFAPGGALARTAGVGTKASSKILPGALEKGTPFLKNMLARAIRGGVASGGFGLLNPETPLEDLPEEVLMGAALDPAFGVAGKAIKGLGKGFDFALEKTPVAGSLYKGIKNLKNKKFTEVLDELVQKSEASEPAIAGQGFKDKVSTINNEVFEKYKSIKDPLLKKYGDEKASPKKLIEAINGKLSEIGLTDKLGNVDDASPLLVGPNAPEYNFLIKLRGKLLQNPSLKEYEALTKSLFDNNKSKSLYGEGVEGLFDNLDDIITNKNLNSKDVRKAKKELSNTLNLISETKEISNKPTLVGDHWDNAKIQLKEKISQINEKSKALKFKDEILAISDNLNVPSSISGKTLKERNVLSNTLKTLKSDRSNLQRELLLAKQKIAGDARSKLEGLQEKLSLEDEALQTLKLGAEDKAQESVGAFREARKEFATQRPFIERLMKLTEKDPEKIVSSARAQMPGSFAKSAIEANPALRDPIKQAILADIGRVAKDPKKLNQVMESYGDNSLKYIFDQEYSTLEKLAGKSEGFLKKLIGKSKGKTPLPIGMLDAVNYYLPQPAQ